MVERSALLVDHFLPRAPYRQWTLTVPFRVRMQILVDGQLFSAVFAAFVRKVFAWQRRRAKKIGIANPLCGGLSLIQRYGSLLQVNPHTHCWIPDGVFYEEAPGKLQFQWLPPPEQTDVEQLLELVRRRVLKLCGQREVEPDEQQQALLAESFPPRPWPAPDVEESPRPIPLCATSDGFSLHAGLHAPANKRKKLERLLRYGMRPAISNRRLSLTPQGKVRLKLRKPYYTGQTEVLFEPLVFLRRLAQLIPPPRQNQIRFYGVFSSHSKHKALLAQLVPRPPQARASAPSPATHLPRPSADTAATPVPMHHPDGLPPVTVFDETTRPIGAHPAPSPESSAVAEEKHVPEQSNQLRSYRMLWAEVLRRTFSEDLAACSLCQGRMKLVSLIKKPSAVRKICEHLGYPTELPPVGPARSPPEDELDFGDELGDEHSD